MQNGLIDESAIDKSVKRVLKARFELGELDDPSKVSWPKIPFSVVASAAHVSLALKMARESMTLLLNKQNVLPLKRGNLTVAVMGPNAKDSVMMWGNYNGVPAHTVTVLDGIRAALGKGDKLIYEQGCPCIGDDLLESVFSECKSEGRPGFSARYWNNVNHEGKVDVETRVMTPFNFCTSGATVFAPGVNLTDFSATYNATYVPKASGEVIFDVYSFGKGRLLVNQKEAMSFYNSHGGNKQSYALQVEAGKKYDIELQFEYLQSDAQLNFDMGFKKKVDIAKSVNAVRNADVVVFVGGISPSLEGEEMGVDLPGFKKGDRTSIELPEVQRNLLAALHRAGKKVILVNCSGSPVGLVPETETCEAILQAWYPGQQGGRAVADVLFGDYNPAGRLPVSVPRSVGQIPVYYNKKAPRNHDYVEMAASPLYGFGYGLSYTTFEYSDLQITQKSPCHFEVSFKVKTTGNYDGEEVAQLYLKDEYASVVQPLKQLKHFERFFLRKGEEKEILFTLTEKDLSIIDRSMKHVVETGDFRIMIGASSDDIRLTTHISVKSVSGSKNLR